MFNSTSDKGMFVLGQLLFAFLYVIFSSPYFAPPDSELAKTIALVSLLLLFFSFGLVVAKIPRQKDRRKGLFVTSVLFILALLLGIGAGTPDVISIERARINTRKQTKEVKIGISLGEAEKNKNIESDNNKKTEKPEEGKPLKKFDDLVQRKNYDIENINNAKEQVLYSNKTEEQIIEDIVQLVPQGYYDWSCSRVGCGYTNASNVWTISIANLLGSILIKIASLGFLIATFNNVKSSSFRKYIKKRLKS